MAACVTPGVEGGGGLLVSKKVLFQFVLLGDGEGSVSAKSHGPGPGTLPSTCLRPGEMLAIGSPPTLGSSYTGSVDPSFTSVFFVGPLQRIRRE